MYIGTALGFIVDNEESAGNPPVRKVLHNPGFVTIGDVFWTWLSGTRGRDIIKLP